MEIQHRKGKYMGTISNALAMLASAVTPTATVTSPVVEAGVSSPSSGSGSSTTGLNKFALATLANILEAQAQLVQGASSSSGSGDSLAANAVVDAATAAGNAAQAKAAYQASINLEEKTIISSFNINV
jgi:hypothetical protein